MGDEPLGDAVDSEEPPALTDARRGAACLNRTAAVGRLRAHLHAAGDDGRFGLAGHAGQKAVERGGFMQGLLPGQPRPGGLGTGAHRHRAKRRHLHGLSVAGLYARLDRGPVDRQLHGRADHGLRRAGQALCAAFAAHRRDHRARLVRCPLWRSARGPRGFAGDPGLSDVPDDRPVQGRRDRDEAGLARHGPWRWSTAPKTRPKRLRYAVT